MSISTMLMYHQTNDIILYFSSYLMLVVTSFIIAIVLYQTIKNMTNHNVCVQE